jgi:hypothetical protein
MNRNKQDPVAQPEEWGFVLHGFYSMVNNQTLNLKKGGRNHEKAGSVLH